jgi:hypothetical protein
MNLFSEVKKKIEILIEFDLLLGKITSSIC